MNLSKTTYKENFFSVSNLFWTALTGTESTAKIMSDTSIKRRANIKGVANNGRVYETLEIANSLLSADTNADEG